MTFDIFLPRGVTFLFCFTPSGLYPPFSIHLLGPVCSEYMSWTLNQLHLFWHCVCKRNDFVLFDGTTITGKQKLVFAESLLIFLKRKRYFQEKLLIIHFNLFFSSKTLSQNVNRVHDIGNHEEIFST